jgi:hypothetical protein
MKTPFSQTEINNFIANHGLDYDLLCKAEGLTYKVDNDECLMALGYVWLSVFQVWVIDSESKYHNVELFNYIKKIGK